MSFDVAVAVRRPGRLVEAAFAGPAVALVGRSGVGKSTVLHAVAGLLRPERGHVRIGGRTLFDAATRADLPPERRRLGYVFQDARLFPHLRVRANLRYGRGRGGRFDEAAAVELLGLSGLLDRWPRTLSGGEARRVAIGRALLSDPHALLLDEPFASLDPARREELVRAVERIRDDLELPILLVTHDPAEAERIAATVIRLE